MTIDPRQANDALRKRIEQADKEQNGKMPDAALHQLYKNTCHARQVSFEEFKRNYGAGNSEPDGPQFDACDDESKLHDEIIKHCNSQWPKWKFRHARMDRPTTEPLGIEDFTIFLPCGGLLHVECKARGKKLSAEQMSWAKELSMLGHIVHTIYSFREFLEVLDTIYRRNIDCNLR